MRTPLARVEITGPTALVTAAEAAAGDLRNASKITGELVFTSDDERDSIEVTAELAESD